MRMPTPIITSLQNLKEVYKDLVRIDDLESPRENTPYTYKLVDLEDVLKELCKAVGVPYEHLEDY